jgi:hypothetical protein
MHFHDPDFWQNWQPTMKASLCFVRQGGMVLMIRKKRGLGAGKINGPGGRLELGESALEAAIRELLKLPATPPHLDAARLEALPESPGVYVFVGASGQPLYVGKARDLRKRRVGIKGLRGRHRLHGNLSATANQDAAYVDLSFACHLGKSTPALRTGEPADVVVESDHEQDQDERNADDANTFNHDAREWLSST